MAKNFIGAAREAAEQAAKKHAEETGKPFDEAGSRKQTMLGAVIAITLAVAFVWWWNQ